MITVEKLLQFDLLPNSDLVKIVSIYNQISEIKGIHSLIVEMPAFPRVPDAILRNEIIRAVGSTTAIEGNTLTQEQIEEAFHKADQNFSLNRLEQEVQNSREAYKFLIQDIHGEKIDTISLELLRQIHNITTKNIPHVSNIPGKLRTGQVEFGEPQLPSLLPDQASVETAVDAFIVWYNSKAETLDREPVIRALMAHYYLSEIHPFFDGNGRTARAIEAFALLTSKVIHPNFFYLLANFWSRDRNLYLQALRSVRLTGNATEFVQFGLKGLIDELNEVKNKVISKATRLMFMDYVHYLQRVKKKEPNLVTPRMLDFLDLLIDVGEVSLKEFLVTPQIRGLYRSVSDSTKSRDIKKLIDNQLVLASERNGKTFINANVNLLGGLVYQA